MDNPINWSFGVGRVWGIRIRIHLLFVLGAVWILGPSLGSTGEGRGGFGLTYRSGFLITLFLVVLLHEFGHCWGARKSGGQADEILIWPLGGLAMVRPADTPKAHMITTLAGPAVNVILAAICSIILIAFFGGWGAVPWNPFDPFYPVNGSFQFIRDGGIHFWTCSFFTINYLLLLFNLLPIYPFDGGRLLQEFLWTRKGRREATLIATLVGMIGAIVLGIIGLVTGTILLVVLSVFGYLTCYHDRKYAKLEMDEVLGEFGYDFSQGYLSLDPQEQKPKKPGYFERRRVEKARARAERERLDREALSRRVDEILQKISDSGVDSLTPQERKILSEETNRQRSTND